MSRVVWQGVYERRRLLGVTSLLLLLWSLLIVSLFPVLSQLHPSNPVIENMPVLFEGFLGELSYLREFPTFLASQLLTIHLPLVLGVVAVVYGWSVSGAAENRGEFRTRLACPMSRTGLALSSWAVLIAMTTVCMAVVALGVYVALPLIEGDTTIAVSTYVLLMSLAWLYTCTVATLTFAVGITTVQRSLAVVAGFAVVAVGYYMTIFGSVWRGVEGLSWLSLLDYVAAVEVVQQGVIPANIGMLVGVIFGALAVAVVVLNRRDIVR